MPERAGRRRRDFEQPVAVPARVGALSDIADQIIRTTRLEVRAAA